MSGGAARPAPDTRGRLLAQSRHGLAFALLAAALAVEVAAPGISPAAAEAGTLMPASSVVGTSAVVSSRWSGYVVHGPKVSYTSATATWTEPTLHCRRGTSKALSAVWVGLGGYTSDALEQVGVSANCDKNGHAKYFAWFELVPDIAHPIGEKVSAGDTITGLVKLHGLNLVELRIENRTRHWSFVRKITWGTADASSAEWVAEAPFSCLRFKCHTVPLANFGSVTFREVAATGNGSRGTLTNPTWTTTPLTLVPCAPTRSSGRGLERADRRAGPPGASPGTIAGHGSRFSISWIGATHGASPCQSIRPFTTQG